MSWEVVSIVSGAAAALIGGTVAATRAWVDRKQGIRKDNREDWDTFTDKIMKVLDGERSERQRLEGRVDVLTEEVDRLRSRYWKAVAYIRDMLRYLKKHELEPPPIPKELEDDV